MREIKFRVWHIPTGTMHNYLKAKFGLKGMSVTLDGKMRDVDIPSQLTVSNSDIAVMQYTGLQDKNGKEIYEGDIVKTRYDEIVSLFYYKNGFYLHDGLWSNWSAEDIEVIGNIYENPNLLNSPRE